MTHGSAGVRGRSDLPLTTCDSSTDFTSLFSTAYMSMPPVYTSLYVLRQSLWQFRERIAEALLVDGYNYKYDISLPLHCFYDVVREMREKLAGSVVTCCGYGHIGEYRTRPLRPGGGEAR